MIFIKNFKFWKKKISFYFISFNFLCYYCCSINLKRQSEHSGLRPDSSSLVIIYDNEQSEDTSLGHVAFEVSVNGVKELAKVWFLVFCKGLIFFA